jgi:orotidine-5'-phosphate decarboxylase
MSDVAMAEARGRLILALDVPSISAGEALLDELEGHVGLVKVGLELFTACGPAAVEAVKRRGFDVFLDLKLHDIPATVAGAVRAARSLGVSMLTVHTGGGAEMLRRAAEEAGDALRILGVTVLTSLSEEDLRAVSVSGSTSSVVERRAALAASAGCRGIVCSPKEIRLVRAAVGPGVAIVTPGIRPAGADVGDQKRAATPASAIGDGSDYLVVGRPIHGAADKRGAAQAIVEEIRLALAAKGA